MSCAWSNPQFSGLNDAIKDIASNTSHQTHRIKHTKKRRRVLDFGCSRPLIALSCSSQWRGLDMGLGHAALIKENHAFSPSGLEKNSHSAKPSPASQLRGLSASGWARRANIALHAPFSKETTNRRQRVTGNSGGATSARCRGSIPVQGQS